MSVAIDELERLYTLEQAAERLAFPTAHALRMYLKRHPALTTERYRRIGRSWVRLVTETELLHLRAMVIRESVKR